MPKQFANLDNLETFKNSFENWVNGTKGDTLTYNEDTSVLQLKAGNNVLSSVEISSGGSSLKIDDVSGAVATTSTNTITLKWSDSNDIVISGTTIVAWKGTKVVKKAGSAPADRNDGVTVVDNRTRNQYSSTGFTDTNLEYGTTYYYRFFPYTDDYKYTDGTSVSATPTRIVINTVPSQSGTLTYDGSEQTASFSNYDSTKMSIVDDSDKATNAGTYTAYFLPNEGYCWSDGTITSKSVTWSINKAQLIKPEQSGSLTYDTTEQTVTWDSNYDSTKMNVSGNKATNAGTYEATFSIKNNNYEWSDGTSTNKTSTWSIAKASFTATVSISDYAYDGTKSIPSVTNNPGSGAVTYYGRNTSTGTATEWSEVTSTTYNVGTRYIYAVIAETTNYNSYTTSNTSFSISKGTFTPTVSISGYTYGGTKSSPSISNNVSGGSVTYYGRSTSTGTGTVWSNVTSTTYDAGTRYVYAVIAETSNYNSVTTANTSFTIAKASFTASVSIDGYTYAGTKSTPTISNNPGNGTVTYYGRSTSSGTSKNWSSVTSTTYNAGTRYCYAVIAETTNYNSYTTNNTSFTISKASFTASVTINGYSYGGTKSTPSLTSNPGGGTVTYYGRSTSSGSTTAWDNVTSTTYNAGTRYIYAVIAESTNYYGYTTGNTSFTISKGTFTATVSINGYTYAGTKSTPTISNNVSGGSVTYYGRSTSSGTGTAWSNVTSTTYDAGTRYCYAVIAETTNYNSVTTSNTSFTIAKADITGVTVSISGYTYAGTKSTPSLSSNPSGGTVTYYGRSTSSGTATNWSNVTSTTYDAGTRYCYAVIAATTNYNSFTTPNKSFTISQATGSFSINTQTTLVLNPSQTYVDVTVTVVGDGTVQASRNKGDVISTSVTGNVVRISSVNNTADTTGDVWALIYIEDSTNYTYPNSTSITIYANFPSIYGVEWDGTSTSAWSRTDKAANFTDPNPAVNNGYGSSPFDNIYPWRGMERVTDSEAGTLVRIPKFWFKWTKTGSKIKLQISDTEVNGFYVSPAHANRGDGSGERDYVYIAAYYSDYSNKSQPGYVPSSKTRSSWRTAVHNLGSTLWLMDYAMYWTIAMLYLVEFADWNSQSKIGYGHSENDSTYDVNGKTDSMNYHTGTYETSKSKYGPNRYRYIENLWGSLQTHIEGVYFNGTNKRTMNIIKNPSNFTNVTSGGTSIYTRSTQYYWGTPTAWDVSSVSGFEYCLYPSAVSIDEDSYVTYSSDSVTLMQTNQNMTFGGQSNSLESGLFNHLGISSDTSGYGAARIMKLP